MKWYVPWEPPVPDTKPNRVIALIGALCALVAVSALALAAAIVLVFVVIKAVGG